jgi:hypothetical protein
VSLLALGVSIGMHARDGSFAFLSPAKKVDESAAPVAAAAEPEEEETESALEEESFDDIEAELDQEFEDEMLEEEVASKADGASKDEPKSTDDKAEAKSTEKEDASTEKAKKDSEADEQSEDERAEAEAEAEALFRSEDRVEVVQRVANLVDRARLALAQRTGPVERLLLEEEADLVARFEKITVLRVPPAGGREHGLHRARLEPLDQLRHAPPQPLARCAADEPGQH